MAPMVSHLLCFFLSSLLLLPLPSQATSFRHLEKFGSFKHLEGSKKGDKREGIQKVKQYLQRYGYLNTVSHPQHDKYSSSLDSRDDEFDELLESSLKAFQKFYRLNATGTLDSPTAALMSQPRCGFPDHPPSGNGIQPDYVIWEGKKWPSGNMNIHYIMFPDGHPEEVITEGFDAWAGVSNFTFERVRDEKFAEIRVSFAVQDGPGKILANAFPLPNPKITFDTEECWAEGAQPDCFDLKSSATHEMGHVLGLRHSQDPKANMYAHLVRNEARPLTQDDIDGIRAIYST